MFGFRTFNFLRLVALACLVFGARAFAQFEVAPDHFDSDQTEPARSTAVQSKAGTAAPSAGEPATQPASIRAVQLNQQIAEQQALLAEYRTQINAKRKQIEEAFQSLLRTGNEAGEAEALTIYQRELDKLQKSLAPAIRATEATLARLQIEVATKSQLRMSRPAKYRAL